MTQDPVQDLLTLLEDNYAGATACTFRREYVAQKERTRKSYCTVRTLGPASRSPKGVNPHYIRAPVQVDVWGMADLSLDGAGWAALWEGVEQVLEDNQAGFSNGDGDRYSAIELTAEQDLSRNRNPHYMFQLNLRVFKSTT